MFPPESPRRAGSPHYGSTTQSTHCGPERGPVFVLFIRGGAVWRRRPDWRPLAAPSLLPGESGPHAAQRASASQPPKSRATNSGNPPASVPFIRNRVPRPQRDPAGTAYGARAGTPYFSLRQTPSSLSSDEECPAPEAGPPRAHVRTHIRTYARLTLSHAKASVFGSGSERSRKVLFRGL